HFTACTVARGTDTGLQGGQKGVQVRLLLGGQAEGEPLVVEADDVLERGRRAVVKIGRTGGEAPENRALEPTDVLPLSGDQCTARIGGGLDLPGGAIAQGVDRQPR